LRNQLDLPLRIALGLAVGIGLALLWHHYDPLIRERREIERLGFSIIAEIPQR
jgi:capsular polysaccharide biosynthesis protein